MNHQMKKINIALLGACFTLSLQSCFFSQEDIFDQTPSERMESAVSEYHDILTGAPNGWLLDYYAGGERHDIGGVVLLLKFQGNEVTVASDTEVTGYGESQPTPAGKKVTSVYSLLKDEGPMLSFSTYNALIHYWSEPKGVLDADGFEGDYEFVILSATTDKVVLKGKKHGTIMEMKRMPEDQDWDSYIAACRQVRQESAEYSTLVGYQGESQFVPSAYSQSNVISFSDQLYSNTANTQKVSFVYTNKGIRLFEPTEVGGVTCNEFEWNDAEKTFVSTSDATVKLKYERPADYVPIEFYTDNEWEMSYTKRFGRQDTTENVSFTRVNESDTLKMYVTCSSNLSFPLYAKYNPMTGMIEICTQYTTSVRVTTGDDKIMTAYIYLCPWNDEQSAMYMTATAGIVSRTSTLSPRVFSFTDNGRTSGSDLNGFVFYAFGENDLSGERLGVMETYNDIILTQKTN